MLEQRQFSRIPEHLKISCMTGPCNRVMGSLTKDISLGGVRFILSKFIPKDSMIKVRLTFEKLAFSFETYVKVVWIKKEPYGDRYVIGSQFENLQKEAFDYLSRHIEDRLKWAS
jgi:c-di-GMP-binding flagellar brake protein YcgR